MGRLYKLYRLENWLYRHHLLPLAIIVNFLVRVIYSCDIPYQAKIGKGTFFPHCALGVVINKDVIIGENCKILHGVTIGGRGGNGRTGAPVIGNNVLIGCHAQILGPIKIGDNSVVGGVQLL